MLGVHLSNDEMREKGTLAFKIEFSKKIVSEKSPTESEFHKGVLMAWVSNNNKNDYENKTKQTIKVK